VIRSYGDPAHDGLAGYLEQSMRQFPLKQNGASGTGTHRA
jgi:PHB accumulation regulatory domain